jgi:hypothetical protein
MASGAVGTCMQEAPGTIDANGKEVGAGVASLLLGGGSDTVSSGEPLALTLENFIEALPRATQVK